MRTKEVWEILNIREVGRVLHEQGMSPSPVFSSYGIEVYCDSSQKKIIIVDCRGDKREVTIYRGDGMEND